MTTYTPTDETVDNNETTQVITKEYTVPETTNTETIDMGYMIERMNNDKKDIEAILVRFNDARVKYNDGLSGLKSKTPLLEDATASFPEIPEKVLTEE